MDNVYLRPGTEEDCELLFAWRNDPVVRRNSFTTDPVAWEDHVRWYERLLQDEKARQYILMAGETSCGTPVGQIRIRSCEEDPSAFEIGYSVAESARGRGYGRLLLTLVVDAARRDLPQARVLIGRVKKENSASAAAFRSAGYEWEEAQDILIYHKTIRP